MIQSTTGMWLARITSLNRPLSIPTDDQERLRQHRQYLPVQKNLEVSHLHQRSHAIQEKTASRVVMNESSSVSPLKLRRYKIVFPGSGRIATR